MIDALARARAEGPSQHRHGDTHKRIETGHAGTHDSDRHLDEASSRHGQLAVILQAQGKGDRVKR